MNKRKSAVIIFTAIILIVTGILISNRNGYTIYGNTVDKKLNLIVAEILSRDPVIRGFSDIEWITEEEKETLEQSSDKQMLSKLYFISGFYEKLNSNYELAEKYFQESLKYSDNKKSRNLKGRIYYEESNTALINNNYEHSKELFKKVINLYLDEKDEEYFKLIILRSMDLIYNNVGFDECLDILNKALDIAEEIDDESKRQVYYYLSLAYWDANQTIQAIAYKLEALNIAYENKSNNTVASMSIDLGTDFLEMANYDQAIKYFNKAIESIDESYDNSDIKMSYAHLNLYEAYSKSGNYIKAESALRNSELYIKKQEESKRKNDDLVLLEYYNADYLNKLGKVNEAQAALDRCIEKYNNVENEFSYMDFDAMLKELQGNIYFSSGEYDKSLEHYLDLKEIIDERQMIYWKERINEGIYNNYLMLENYKNAAEYAVINNKIQREHISNKNLEYSQYLLNKFDNEIKEERISQLEEEQRIVKIYFRFLGMITIFCILFISIIYKKNSEIKRLNKRFKDLSSTDALTNIPNRRALDEFLSINWNSYMKMQKAVSFIMIDVDYFKKYNDNYGHVQGDEVLRQISNCLQLSCRKSDFIARYGGEEFIIVMLGTEKEQSILVAERIQANMKNLNIMHEHSEVSNRVTLSMGISTTHYFENKNYEEYINLADTALYEAKKIRNTFVHKS